MKDMEQQRQRWVSLFTEKSAGLAIQYSSGGRGRVFDLASDGALQTRPFGGPRWSFGTVTNREAPRLEVWRGYHDPGLHEELCVALAEVGFPEARERFCMVPDEQASSVVVTRGPGVHRSMSVVTRLLRAYPRLGSSLDKLANAGLQLTEGRSPDDNIPNPELHLWTDEARQSGPPKPPRPPQK